MFTPFLALADAPRGVPTSLTSTFTPLDYAIVILPVLLAMGVALYMRRFNRSVADYLAANRSAGRYLICTAQMEMGITAMGAVAGMEIFAQTGFSLSLWGSFLGFSYFILAISGLISYRFRETRALTFHQFFEMRYSKGVRVFATFLNVFSGLFTFGVAPGIAARFFVYLLGLPPAMNLFGIQTPTFLFVMILLMGMAIFFALTGGQLSVMTVDCIEGIISSVLYLVVSFAVLYIFSYRQMSEALCSGPPGKSFIDPFDVSSRADLGYGYLMIGWLMTLYCWRGNAWNASFAASAKSAHEGQMAVILGVWRSQSSGAMGTIIGLGAFVLLHHSHFAGQASLVTQHLIKAIPEADKQLRTELALPTALGALLPMGVKGSLCSIMLMGTIAGMASGLFGFSTGLIQDVFIPLRGRHLDPKAHILILRLAAVALGIFSIWFSMVFRIADYLAFVMQLLSGIYLAGIGCVVWAGLYWNRATNTAAWVSLLVGSGLSMTAAVLQQVWPGFTARSAACLQFGALHDWFLAHPDRMPVNSQILTASIMALSLSLFVIISLLSKKPPYDMDRLLHRGAFAVADEHKVPIKKDLSLQALAGVNENFTKGDKRIAYGVFCYGLTSPVSACFALAWNAFFHRWSPQDWWKWIFFWNVCLPLTIGIITFAWFTWGASHDVVSLFRDLSTVARDDSDDGFVSAEEKPEAG
jgi:SSS family solute:Na+ symporter